MKAFVHAFQGKPWNEECETAYAGFRKLGIDTVLFTTNEELDMRAPEDIVVGGMLIMSHVFGQLGIKLPNYNYPDELACFTGRKIWSAKLRDLSKYQFPIFIKPVEEKAAKGIVVTSWEDLDSYEHMDMDSEILCSEVLSFVSEWRCFVRYGKIIELRKYLGDNSKECDLEVIEDAICKFKNLPAACSLDFGVTVDGRTVLIEVNDGFAIGCYGLLDTDYAKFLMARWAEIVNIEDPFFG